MRDAVDLTAWLAECFVPLRRYRQMRCVTVLFPMRACSGRSTDAPSGQAVASWLSTEPGCRGFQPRFVAMAGLLRVTAAAREA
jgi:hypothetical protein